MPPNLSVHFLCIIDVIKHDLFNAATVLIDSQEWLTMLLLCLSGSVIYWMPFLSDIFYVPMQRTVGFCNTQIGILISTSGITSLFGYFPGGWLADRIGIARSWNSPLMCD